MRLGDRLKKAWDEQPILVGCGCLLLLCFVMCGVGGLLAGLGVQVAGQKISALSGVDSILETSQSLASRGFTFQLSNTTETGTLYRIMPVEPREVSCEELKTALGPHLTGDLSTVVIESESTVPSPTGDMLNKVPIRCSWDPSAMGLDVELSKAVRASPESVPESP
ncbi:MAG: hypothetical protein CMP23_13020 [Rickettsiales bacterium]|nr:hypothetical protein [Rickettsiales bacterium]